LLLLNFEDFCFWWILRIPFVSLRALSLGCFCLFDENCYFYFA
jgi:hypothetical protein